jgi:steroid delta-isomerase-like uncharacterized protein
LGRRWFEQVWNQKRRGAIAEMLTPASIIHDGGTDTKGPEGFHPFYERIRSTFPDLHMDVEDTFAEGDKICVRWSCTGTHTGDGLGIPPTQLTIHVTGIAIFRIADGKLAEAWQNWDMLGMMEQLKGGRKSPTYIGAS